MAGKVKLYCAWFCPFAQRAWIGLLYKGVKFEYIEQDPYDKTPEWLAINPRGLVPTIIHKGKAIYESSVLLEYIDEAWPGGNNLLPKDPYDRALSRIWSDHITKKIVPNYYASLLKKEESSRKEHLDLFSKNLEVLVNGMSKDGPFFMGSQFGLVDIMVFPYVLRIAILKRYRKYELPKEKWVEKLMNWYNHTSQLDYVKKTIQDEEKLIATYKRYEDDTAATEVAEAIRKGQALP